MCVRVYGLTGRERLILYVSVIVYVYMDVDRERESQIGRERDLNVLLMCC